MIAASEWDRCAPWIAAALAEGGETHGLEDVRAMCEAGEARFMPGLRCAAVLEIYRHPRRTFLHLWLVGGDMDELLGALLPAAQAWGLAEGCDAVTSAGRPGWDRVLAPLGFKPIARICIKELGS